MNWLSIINIVAIIIAPIASVIIGQKLQAICTESEITKYQSHCTQGTVALFLCPLDKADLLK